MTLALILLLTLGGLGVYLAMPGGRANAGRAALVVLAGGAAALLALLIPLADQQDTRIWFAVLSLIGLWGAVRVITHSKPVYNALYFILVAISVTGLLILLEATFLAFALMIIYAGAILVTYVFVIMLAQQTGGPTSYDRRAREPFLGVLTGFLLLAVLSTRILSGSGANAVATVTEGIGTPEALGIHLLTEYVVGVQLAGILLLAAMVGAIAIARRPAADAATNGGGE